MRTSERATLVMVVKTLRGPLAAAVAYYLAAEAAFAIGTLSDRIFAPFWPPNIVLLWALLLTPYRRWWLYIGVVFVAHAIAEVGIGMAADQLIVAFATNLMVVALNAVALRHLVGRPPWFDEFGKALRYIVFAAVLNPALAAFGGAFVPIAGGGSLEHYWIFWAHWYCANALGAVTLGPLLLVWRQRDFIKLRRGDLKPNPVAIIGCLAIAVIALIGVSLSGSVGMKAFVPALLYAPLPAVLWMTVRFGAKGASAAILIVTVVLISHTLRFDNPFNDDDPESNVLALQLFLTGLSVPVLLLGSVIDQLRRAEGAMRGLARTVLRERDEERRRVAHDLHESTSQKLVYASILMAKCEPSMPEDKRPLVAEIEDVIRQSIADLRAVSYLLHPPLLTEAGLPLALRSYVNGYASRAAVPIHLDIPADFDRVSDEAELVLFRVVQDILAMLGDRAGSRTAAIRLRHMQVTDEIELTISYERPPRARGHWRLLNPTLAGARKGDVLPLTGIRERLSQVGGRLEVHNETRSTTVKAVIPIVES